MSHVNFHRAALRAISAVICGLLLLAAMAPGHAQQARPAAVKEIRVLFIGNSLTYVNDLPAELQALIAAAYPGGPTLRYEAVTPPGRTLEQQWNEGKAAAKIAEGHWDYVIVQEQSQIPFTERAKVFQYARLFDRAIKHVGAKTVLYMTFPLKKKFEDGDLLPEIYMALGKELGATVVPVDVAWHEAAKRDPQLVLYNKDGVHPAPAGTYLAACCFAETLWGKPAAPIPAHRADVNQDHKLLVDLPQQQAGELQKAAAAVVTPAAAPPRAVAVDGRTRPLLRVVTSVSKSGPWVELFNGKDTAGWNDDQSRFGRSKTAS